MRPFERLSQVYDFGWGDFAESYIELVNEFIQERSIPQARILDLACGTGILALGLAQYDHVVHGVDISPEMIAVAESKSIGLPNLSFEIQDMAQFSVDGQFHMVTCTFDSINYIRSLDDVQEMFHHIASVMYDGGLFIFDTNTKYLYLSHADETIKREIGGHSFIEHCNYDSVHNEATITFAFSDGTYEIHRQRPYDYEQLNPLLMSAGLQVVHLFSWFQHLPYSSKTPKLFCVAEKRREA